MTLAELVCSICLGEAGDYAVTLDGKPVCPSCRNGHSSALEIARELADAAHDLSVGISTGQGVQESLERAEHLIFVLGHSLRKDT